MKILTSKNKLKEQIAKDCSQFEGLSGWFRGHSLDIIKKDVYRIFDIKVDIDYVLDIGTCLGEVSYACSKLFPDAYIVAVEATPETYIKACRNLKKTSVIVNNWAIYEHDDVGLQISRKNKNNIGSNKSLEGNFNECLSCKIETLIKRHDIDLTKNCLLKIDCEGCEEFVFKNIELCKKFYQISCEIHPWVKNKEVIYNFLREITHTHSIIKGKYDENKLSEMIFRRK